MCDTYKVGTTIWAGATSTCSAGATPLRFVRRGLTVAQGAERGAHGYAGHLAPLPFGVRQQYDAALWKSLSSYMSRCSYSR
jgi:hypothetical protein